MASISFFERLKTIWNLVVSQSFFMTLFVILILTLIILLINVKVKSKAPRYAAAIVYFGLAVLALARYGHYVLTFNDSVVEKIFKAMYFPNVVVYLSMLIISILLMIANIIDKRFSVFGKIISSVSFFLVWFLFVLVVDTVKQSRLNFYEVKELYSDKTVMVLLQASMAIFCVWIGIFVIDLIVRKIADRMDKRVLEKNDDNNLQINNYESINIDNNINNYKPLDMNKGINDYKAIIDNDISDYKPINNNVIGNTINNINDVKEVNEKIISSVNQTSENTNDDEFL